MITNSDGINDDEEFKTDFNYENLQDYRSS